MDYQDCNLCKICECTEKKCMYKGADSPQVYFVGEAPGPEENKAGLPFIGRAGKYLHNILNEFGLNENNCGFWNVVLCYPKKDDSDSFRTPYDDEIANCIHNVLEDIYNKSPKVVVCLGSTSSRAFIGSEFTRITDVRGKSFSLEINDKKFTVIPTYHPSYLMRNSSNQNSLNEFKKDIKKAMNIATGVSFDEDNKNEFNDDTDLCLNYSEFDNFLRREIDEKSVIAYDIESNAREKTSRDFRVVGFSLASRHDKGCYVVLDSLDYKMSDRDRKLIESRLRKVLTSKDKVHIYNCMYELPSTLNWIGVEVKNVNDIFSTVKLMMGNATKYQGNGGLKIQCEMNLGINDWSRDLDEYFGCIWKLRSGNEEYWDRIRRILGKYYDSNEVEDLVLKIEDVIEDDSNFENEVLSYGLAPYKLIGKYGGIDSEVLFDLHDFYEKRMNEENKKMGINLQRCNEYWNDHHYAGYTLERNGAYFNDKIASEIDEWCASGMLESIKNLVKSPLSEEYIRGKLDYDFSLFIKDNFLVQVLGSHLSPKRLYKTSVLVDTDGDGDTEMKLSGMSLQKDKNGRYKLSLDHIMSLGRKWLDDNKIVYENWYHRTINKYLNSDLQVSDYKYLINPTSTGQDFKDFVTKILINDDIKIAKFYSELVYVIESPSFDIDLYHGDDQRLLSLVYKLKVAGDEISDQKKLAVFVKFLQENPKLYSRKVATARDTAINYRIDSFQDDNMIELYNHYRMCGIDIEDESTWTENFRWLYNFRYYKKYNKIRTTYIDGKVGRNSVWFVNEDSYRNGDKLTKREFRYYDKDKHDTEGMTTVLQSDFFVDSADTGRWRASMHTLPAGDSIKRIYTSRFKGGIIAMPDCSQAEVRCLAAQSGDENLLNAFKSGGLDIHKYTAAQCFHDGDMSKVTKAERSFAKGAVFGILYGESVRSFADSFTHGDMNEAQKIFDKLFTAFPKIKDYIEESHNQFNKDHKVTTLTDRFINLEQQYNEYLQNKEEGWGDADRPLRQSQNFRIQGATCDIAAMILYKICEFIRNEDLKSKPFCFIHDSIEIDLHPDEAFLMLDKLRPIFNEYPMKEFGVPMASDIVFSVNMGAEIEMIDMVHDDEYNDVTITIKGFEDDINAVIDNWTGVYKTIDLLEEDRKEEDKIYNPRSGLFQKKVVISKYFGTYRQKVTRKYHIVRK